MSREPARPVATARMVRVRTVAGPFHARVLAARLGADGILTELRGNVGGPYPVGETSVWVPEGEAEVARALLLADEVEVGFVDPDGGLGGPGASPASRRARPRRVRLRRVAAAGGILAVVAGALAAHVGL